MVEVTVPTARGVRLAGTLQHPTGEPRQGWAVLFAHGFLTDRSSRGRADRIGAAYRRAGYATLAFDFSGCGDSDDDVVTVENEVQDLEAASTFLAEQGWARQVVHGHSLGALVALRSGCAHAEAMVLTGALSGPVVHPWEEILGPGPMAELRTTGRTDVIDDGPGARERMQLSVQTLADFTDVDQEEVLGTVTCPVLLVHGGALVDGEEHPLLTRSRIGLPLLPAGSRLEVVPGAEHGLLDRSDEVAALALAWLSEVTG
ncbi:alpha/beta hydrolase [Cellulomonas bogoriensis]|uniref:Alpha/beta hydrolase n=1 Tax=Cellulomonas bogoriensis 69B4 = DSM 16987 TaxID=1386082 RepID=A0A0A0BZ59_9CELL|nr:alpha/beta hydrolase [Cellulomonas bogoriensis]KGM13191.1 alpha/beta hydrolase [Cellulomonas bogoriensis 69B4 = DSM 16987]